MGVAHRYFISPASGLVLFDGILPSYFRWALLILFPMGVTHRYFISPASGLVIDGILPSYFRWALPIGNLFCPLRGLFLFDGI
jgi:hypothetical protein